MTPLRWFLSLFRKRQTKQQLPAGKKLAIGMLDVNQGRKW